MGAKGGITRRAALVTIRQGGHLFEGPYLLSPWFQGNQKEMSHSGTSHTHIMFAKG